MNNLEILQKYFSSGTATQEKDFIYDVFVKNDNFSDIITPASRSIRLLVGSKGSGKSALLEYLFQECQKNKIPAISLNPIDIEVGDISEDDANFVLVQKIYKSLVHEIAIKVGTDLGGLISEQQKALVNEAIAVGARQLPPTDALLRVLLPIGKAVTQIDFGEMLPKQTTTTRSSVTTINSSLSDELSFYILFDDIDMFGNPGSPKYLDTIWCAILAFKILAEKLPNVRPIVTLRNEIWRRIRDGRNNYRDQVDHIRPMIRYLLPTSANMKSILKKRLEYCKTFLPNATADDCYTPFFENTNCKVPSSNERRFWEDYLVTASRERPRDTVQLVQHLVSHALQEKHKRINDEDVEQTALLYSQERVDDLVNENSDLCPQLETVIRAFASSNFKSEPDDVKQFLQGIPGRGCIMIGGLALKPANKEDTLKLWKLLYEIEFLTPRAKDVTQTKGYMHIRPSDDSTLVCESRWNDMQKYLWEVHPCYRSFLINIAQQNRRMAGFHRAI